MGATRKRTRKRRLRFKPLPNWGLLALGLGIGTVLTLLVQFVIQRASAPGSGINTLISGIERPKPGSGDKSAPPAAAPKPPQPKYDFYTILPEIETVLPDKGSASSKASGVETGVSYILQVASFTRFEDADHLKAKLALAGIVSHIQKITIEGRGEYHRVRLGPYSNLGDLDAADKRLRALGIQALRLKIRGEG
jgi:cell division septation protein DedD